MLDEIRADLTVGKFEDLTRYPGGSVHAVGHRPDGDLGGVEARPQATEHFAADPAMQRAHTVDPLRQPHAHDSHVEYGWIAARVCLGTQG